MAPATEAPATDQPGLAAGHGDRVGQDACSHGPQLRPVLVLDTATNDYVGFDNDVAREMVKRLSTETGTNIEIEWVTPNWDLITAGSWGGRRDISVGSMSVTVTRAKVVDFVDPYYYDFGVVAVPTDLPAPSRSTNWLGRPSAWVPRQPTSSG